MFELQHPNVLWFMVPALLVLGYLCMTGPRLTAGWRKYGLTTLTLVTIACLFLALAGPYRIQTQDRDTAVFLVDLSSSIADSQLDVAAGEIQSRTLGLPAQTDWHVVGFSAYPIRLPVTVDALEPGALPKMRATATLGDVTLDPNYFEETNIASAILYARSLIGQRGRITILSDGLATQGQGELATAGLAELGITLETLPLETVVTSEIVLQSLDAPQPIYQGQTASLRVTLDSTISGPAQIDAVHLESGRRQTVTEELSPGVHTFELPMDTEQERMSSYRVTVSSDQDTWANNNRGRLAVPILPKPKVAVLATQDSSATALSRWLQDDAQVTRWDQREPLDSTDLLIITDGSPDQLSETQVNQIRRHVSAGMGLWVLPGPSLIRHALLSEGSDLAEVLPVKPLQYGKQSNPNTTVVLIIDTSGSMKATRIQLAKEIARMAISHLNGHDKVGIVEFYGARRWAAPIQSAANRLDINRALNRLTAGGGTIILPALEEAHYALLNTSSTTKHIVVISDGGVESADYESMLRKIARDNISVSTILVGPAAHTGFMADLSQWGRGAFFHAGDRFRLPDLNFKSVQNKSGAPLQQNTDPVAATFASSVLAGISPAALEAPTSSLAVSPRRAAQVPLTLASGRPLICQWQYGLGQVAFWSVDLLHEEPATNASAQAWANLAANQCRKLYRSKQPDWELTWRRQYERVYFTVTMRPGVEAQRLELILQGQDTAPQVQPLNRVDARHWVAQARDLDEGLYQVTLNSEAGQLLAQTAFAINTIPELKACRADTALLQRLETAGNDQAGETPPLRTRDLRIPILMLALLSLLAHVILRRLPHKWLKRAAPVALWLLVLLPANTSRAAEDPNRSYVMGRLSGLPQASAPQDPMLALLCGDTSLVDQILANDFSRAMQRGYGQYRRQQYAAAYDLFERALNLAQIEEDQKYALAWALLTAEKSGRMAELERALLQGSTLSPYQIKGLLLAYGLQGDLGKALALHDRINAAEDLSEAFKLETAREILNLATVGDPNLDTTALFEQAAARTTDPSLGVGLVRLHLLNGDREEGRDELQRLIRITTQPSRKLFLAEQAAQMAFYELAETVASDVMQHAPDYAYQAGLFQVQLAIQRGRPDEASRLLDEMTIALSLTDKQSFEVAQIYEQLALYPKAMALYQSLSQRTEAIDVAMRMAWLYEKMQDMRAAYETWLKLWRQCNEEHRLYQIQPRLLDLGARTGQLAALAVELEEDLETQGPDPKALALLIDLYVSVGDSISAVELAKQYYGQDSVESLAQQQRIYLRCHEYGRCHRVLQRLLEIDPAQTQSYLQQLAVIALERGNERDAMAAARAIEAAQNADLVDEEYAAGIMSLMGRTDEAAQTYYRMLQRDPNNAELWLLWANTAQQAGQGDRAIAQLTQRLNDTVSDDVFTVAVDGLLNLEADPDTLKNTLAQILQRLAEAPQKVYFYRLAVDVLEELATKPIAAQDLLMLACAHAPNRRPMFIREAQMHCAQALDVTTQLDLGILLVTMDYRFPPQLYIDLGLQFLGQGKEAIAQTLFHHNGLLQKDPSLGVQIIDYYDRHARYDKAATLTRECLSGVPDDLALRMRSAAFEEVTGNFPLAFKQYRQLYELSMGAMSLETINKDKSKRPAWDDPDKNANAGDRYSYIALQGLLVTDNPQTPLANLCGDWERTILNEVRRRQELPSLLYQFWRDYDSLCVASNQTERADRTARAIMEECPTCDLHRDLMQNRCTWGHYPAALIWAHELEPTQWPRELLRWSESQRPLSSTQGLVNAMVHAWIMGQDQQANEFLHALPASPLPQTNEKEWTALMRQSIVGAYLFAEMDRVKPLLVKQLESVAPFEDPRIKHLVSAVWTMLSPADRRWYIRELETTLAQRDDLAFYLESRKVNCGLQSYISLDKALRFKPPSSGERTKASFWATVLPLIKPSERLTLLSNVVQTLSKSRQRLFLWKVFRRLEYPCTDSELESYLTLYRSLPPSRIPTENDYAELAIHDSPNPSFWVTLTQDLLTEYPDHWAINASVALARLHAGQLDVAAHQVSEIIDLWTDQDGDMSFQGTQLIKELIRQLPVSSLQSLLEDQQILADVMGISLHGKYLESLVCQYLGRWAEARAAIRVCFHMQPGSNAIWRDLLHLHRQSGHQRELAEAISQSLQGDKRPRSTQCVALSEAYLETNRLSLALQAVAMDSIEVIRNRSYLFVHHETDNQEQLPQAFRKFMIDCRTLQRSSFLKWTQVDSLDGILGFKTPSPYSYATTVMGQHQYLEDDYRRYWQAIRPESRDLHHMAEGWASITIQSDQAERQFQDLEEQIKNKAGSIPKVLALWSQLGRKHHFQSSAQIDKLVSHTRADDFDLWHWIAQAYLRQNQPIKASRAMAWYCLNQWFESSIEDDLFDNLAICRDLDTQLYDKLKSVLAYNPRQRFDYNRDVQRLSWMIQNDPGERLDAQAQKLVDRLNAVNPPVNPSKLTYPLMSYAVYQDDTRGFRDYLVKTLLDLDDIYPAQQVIDFSEIISHSKDANAVSVFLESSRSTIQDLIASGRLPKQAAVPQLAMLAVAYYDNDDFSSAEETLDKASALLTEPSKLALWLVDALDHCGQPDKAKSVYESTKQAGLVSRARDVGRGVR